MRELKPDGAMPVYLMYPRFLLELEINDTAKMVYLLLYDRARLSIQNGWLDEDGSMSTIPKSIWLKPCTAQRPPSAPP